MQISTDKSHEVTFEVMPVKPAFDEAPTEPEAPVVVPEPVQEPVSA